MDNAGAVVLVVDDEPSVRQFLKASLSRLGYNVLEAENGMQGLEVVQSRNGDVDVVVADMKMPQMTGHEMAHRIHHQWPDIRIVAITGTAFLEEIELPSKVPIVAKPFAIKELVDHIDPGAHPPLS